MSVIITKQQQQQQCLPDHPVHDEDVAQKSHHANDGVESRDRYGYDNTPGVPQRTLLLGVVLQPVAHQAALLVREGDIEGDDGVQVGQRELSSWHRVRLHAAVHSARGAENLRAQLPEGTWNCLKGEARHRLSPKSGKKVKGFPKNCVWKNWGGIEEETVALQQRPAVSVRSSSVRAPLILSKISTSQPRRSAIPVRRRQGCAWWASTGDGKVMGAPYLNLH